MTTTIDYLTNAGTLRKQAAETMRAELLGDGEVTVKIALDQIDANPFQPRTDFGDVDAMAQSLFAQGQDYPIIVRMVGNRFQVADGETRLRAQRLNVGRYPDYPNTIAAVVRDLSDQDMAVMALRTAYQRKGLTPIEEARGLKQLETAFGLTHMQVAALVGKTHGYILERVRLLNLPVDIQQLLCHRDNPITPGHAVALGSVADGTCRQMLADLVVTKGLPIVEIRRRAELVKEVDALGPMESTRRDKFVAQAVLGTFDAKAAARPQAQAQSEPSLFDELREHWKHLSASQQHELVATARSWAQEAGSERLGRRA